MLWNSKSVVELDKFKASSYTNYAPKSLWLKKSWRTLFIRVAVLILLVSLGTYLYRQSSSQQDDLISKINEYYWYNQKQTGSSLLLGNNNGESSSSFASFIDESDKLFDRYLEDSMPPPHKDFDVKYLVHADNYDTLIKKFGLSRILKSFTFQERCDLYFKQLYVSEPEWWVDPFYGYSFERGGLYEKGKFILDKSHEYEKEKAEELKIKESEVEVTQDMRDEWGTLYDKIRLQTHTDEQIIHNALTSVKLFNECYLSKSDNKKASVDNFVKQQLSALKQVSSITNKKDVTGLEETDKDNLLKISFDTCADLETRIYPWLSKLLPTYKRWDGTTIKNDLPIMCKYNEAVECKKPAPDFEPIDSPLTGNKLCFMDEFKSKLNGKGLAMTINEKSHLEITIRFIRLLRALGNKLPIQIIYNDEISQEGMDQMVKASRNELYDQNGQLLIEQDIWFVDVSDCLTDRGKGMFGGYANKLLATLFNSYSEMMLVDADAVLVQNPSYFFDLPSYKQSGTLFFKDRNAFEQRPKDDTLFFRKLMPSKYDTILFDIPQITGYTLDRNFFQGINHYMESGLVMINRERKFTQAFMMSQLNFIKPANHRMYGDKELFWLAMTVLGDESYNFNKLGCASIGIETPELERVHHAPQGKKSFKSKEICSNHPAHISGDDEHTLLWFNSGFQFCGQVDNVDFEKEFNEKFRYMLMESVDQFKKVFKDKLIIKEAVVPPDNIKLGLIAENGEHEPDRAWINYRAYCNGYTWCAYSSIGGNVLNDISKEVSGTSLQSGYFIQFNDKEIAHTKYLGDIWMSEFDFRSAAQKQKDAKAAKP